MTTTKTSFTIASNSCTGAIAGGKTCAIGVTFKPAVTGLASASLVVKDGDSSNPQLIPLRGTGIGTSLSPTSLSFGSVVDGSSSALTTTLTNKGTVGLSSISASVSGINASNFTFTTTCGATLGAASSCTYSVTFKPSTTSAESGTLNIKDNENLSPGFPVSLSGIGQLK